jgi:hypothetical protein
MKDYQYGVLVSHESGFDSIIAIYPSLELAEAHLRRVRRDGYDACLVTVDLPKGE